MPSEFIPFIALSMVLPFYNEEDCVEQVVCELYSVLKQQGISFEIVAVQNGSHDSTPQILGELGKRFAELKVVDVSQNRGFGYGVIQGLAKSNGNLVGYMPGDGQIDPMVLPSIIQQMEQAQADIGKGRRVIRRDGWDRWLISKSYNLIGRLMFGLSTDDINGHPKLMTRNAFNLLQLSSHDHFIDAELLLKAQVLDLRICEVDLEFRKRETGHSKVRVWIASLEFLKNILLVRFNKSRLWQNQTERNIKTHMDSPRV